MSMQLTRLRVEQLRQFRQPHEISGLTPGLNILAGPNEAGKSTLVRAIRAAFFERHRSTAVDDLRPWGDPSAAPEVELDFLLDGQPAQLGKRFLGRKRCTLRIGTLALEGVEAEDHLAQLFGFGFAGKGASKAEHWGIPGLLWVDQGTGQELDVSHAREHLHDALGGLAQAGALAASGGDELLEALRGQRAELLTGAGKPRAGYAEAIERVAALVQQSQALQAQIALYQTQVDQLAELRQQHQADEQAQPWRQWRQQLEAAQQQLQGLQARESQLQADRLRLQQLQRTRELLGRELAGQAQQAQAAQARGQALARAGEVLAAAEAALAAARAPAEAAQRAASDAAETLRLARQEANRAALLADWQAAQAGLAQQQQALREADAAAGRLRALRAELTTTPLSRAQLDRLRQLERALGDASLRHQAVATRLQFRWLPGQTVQLIQPGAERALQGEGECLLDSAATLALPGLGQLTITPGGQDLAELAQAQVAARDALQSALQRLGLADLAEAEARFVRQQEQLAQVALAEQALAIYAPQGLEALQQGAAELSSRMQARQEALSRLPAPAAAPALALAEADHDAAQQALQQALAAQAQAQTRHATALAAREQAQRELQAAEAALADPARQQRLAEQQAQALALQAEHEALAGRIAEAEAVLREARPEIVAQDIQRWQRSVEQAEQLHRERREQILRLETVLQQVGAEGLEEQQARLAGERVRAQRRQEELARRAAALELLCGRLEAKRQATLARLQAPLMARLQHYLPLLWPGASLQLGADLAPRALSRPGAAGQAESGEVEALSFGAREQLRLISRLAYADLLQAAGRPTLLILDDALVHSDAQRLAQMKRVLFDAAQRHQLLLFTCHPQSWQDMGVAVRPLR